MLFADMEGGLCSSFVDWVGIERKAWEKIPFPCQLSADPGFHKSELIACRRVQVVVWILVITRQKSGILRNI